MPIPVVCGNCQTRLNAPDAAAGRKVKCPKCQTVMPVPAAADAAPPPPPPPPAAGGSPFDFGGESSPPPPPRREGGGSRPPRPAPEPESPAPPAGGGGAFDFGAAVASGGGGRERGEREDRPRRRRDEDDAPPADRGDRPRRPRPRDDDPDASDDRPRGRRPDGGEKKKSMLPMLLLGGGLLLLVCCGGGGVAGYFALGKIKEAAEKKKAELDELEKRIADEKKKREGGAPSAKATPPAGWKSFTATDGSFKAYFPADPMESDGVPLPPPLGKKGIPAARGKMYVASSDDMIVLATVFKFQSSFPAAERDKALDRMIRLDGSTKGAKVDVKDADWLGQKGKELMTRMPGEAAVNVTRYVVVGDTGYVGMIQYKGARKEELEKGFFDTLEPLSK